MSRFDAPSALALHVLATLQELRANSARPISQADLLHAYYQAETPDRVHDALEELLDQRLIATLRHTRDGVTQSVYWPTGLHPLTAPTLEEIAAMSESKSARLIRLLAAYGRQTATELALRADAEGANIPAKTVGGLLAYAVSRGDVTVTKEGGTTYYQVREHTPADAVKEETHQGHDLLLARISELNAELSASQANEKVESDRATAQANDIAAICRALDVPHAGAAVAEIQHLVAMSEARTDQVFGDLGRYRALLDTLATALAVDSYDSLPAAIGCLQAGVPHTTASPIGYAVMLDSPDIAIHPDLEAARAEAIRFLFEDHIESAHVVGVIATARKAVTWSDAG